MKLPKTQKKYCPYCKKHTEHKVVVEKSKQRPKTRKHALKWGARHQAKIESGYGSFPKPKAATPKKIAKRANIRFECSVCKKKHHRQRVKRAKKFEQVQG